MFLLKIVYKEKKNTKSQPKKNVRWIVNVGTHFDHKPKVWLDPSPISPIQWICRKCVGQLGSNEWDNG